jgi:hypothetical protein
MLEYRAYLVGRDGHFYNVVHLTCADDDQAIECAKALVDGGDVELWQLDRKVATLGKVLKKA